VPYTPPAGGGGSPELAAAGAPTGNGGPPKPSATEASSGSFPSLAEPPSPSATAAAPTAPTEASSPSQGLAPSPLLSEAGDDMSDTASESGAESDYGTSQASTSTPGEGDKYQHRLSGDRSMERPLVERPLILAPADPSRGDFSHPSQARAS